MLQKIKFYLSPFFLIKRYLVNDIKDTLAVYNFDGNILDIGCGSKPYQALFKKASRYVGIDFKIYSKNNDFIREQPDYYFDDSYEQTLSLPFLNEEFDHAVAFQVLEHHPKPQKLIDEMFRVVKNGGYLLLSAPFLGGLHEKPNDFQRLTPYGFCEMLKCHNHKVIRVVKEGLLFSTIAMLLNEHLNTFAAKGKIHYCAGACILPLLVFISCGGLLLDKIFKTENIYYNQLFLIKKYE